MKLPNLNDLTITREALPEDALMDQECDCDFSHEDAGDPYLLHHHGACCWKHAAQRLYDQSEWGWCCASVTVSYLDVSSEPQYLGHCSYKDELAFMSDGYYSTLLQEATASLFEKLETIYNALKE